MLNCLNCGRWALASNLFFKPNSACPWARWGRPAIICNDSRMVQFWKRVISADWRSARALLHDWERLSVHLGRQLGDSAEIVRPVLVDGARRTAYIDRQVA